MPPNGRRAEWETVTGQTVAGLRGPVAKNGTAVVADYQEPPQDVCEGRLYENIKAAFDGPTFKKGLDKFRREVGLHMEK